MCAICQVYLKNLLRISEYAPELRDRILETIVDRLIQIDVRSFSISLNFYANVGTHP